METQSKGTVLVTKAVVTQGKGAVLPGVAWIAACTSGRLRNAADHSESHGSSAAHRRSTPPLPPVSDPHKDRVAREARWWRQLGHTADTQLPGKYGYGSTAAAAGRWALRIVLRITQRSCRPAASAEFAQSGKSSA